MAEVAWSSGRSFQSYQNGGGGGDSSSATSGTSGDEDLAPGVPVTPEVSVWGLVDRAGTGEGVAVSKTSAGLLDFTLPLMDDKNAKPASYGTFDPDL